MRTLAALLVLSFLLLSARASAQDTTWFGSTMWAPDSMRWEAVPGGVWTFDSGVGSDFDHTDPGLYPFKDPSLHAHMEGWIGRDATYVVNPYFRRLGGSNFAAAPDTCVGAAAGLGGSYSFFAGVTQFEADSRCYAAGQGYGNNWFVCVEQTFAYTGGAVTLEYDFVNDTEPGFDYSYVLVDTVGGGSLWNLSSVARYNGQVSDHAVHDLIPGITLPETPTGSITIVFCAASDGAYSDEDGLYATDCGAFAVDNIQLSGAIIHLADFETGDDGWVLHQPGPTTGGDWTDLVHLNDVPPPGVPGPCAMTDTVLAFTGMHLSGVNRGLNNLAVSPWIDLKAADVLHQPGRIIVFDLYTDLPIVSFSGPSYLLLIEAQWYPDVCATSGAVRTSAFTSDGQYGWPNGGDPFCTPPGGPPYRRDYTAVIPPTAEQVRIAVGVWAACGRTLDPCPTDQTIWIDNVRFGVHDTTSTTAVRDADPPSKSGILLLSANPLRETDRSARFRVEGAGAGPVNLEIFDIAGRRVRTLTAAAPPFEMVWNLRNAAGVPVSVGIYFARVAGSHVPIQRVVVLP